MRDGVIQYGILRLFIIINIFQNYTIHVKVTFTFNKNCTTEAKKKYHLLLSYLTDFCGTYERLYCRKFIKSVLK